jgi:peptide deformylase
MHLGYPVDPRGFDLRGRNPHIRAMAILKIAKMGHPVLRQRAAEVDDPKSPEIRRLVVDMIETLEDIGGAGLAAPQVHVPLRVVIFSVPSERISEEPGAETVPLTILVNPVVTPLTRDTELGWEGCLSVPGLRGAVPRFTKVRYSGVTLEAEPIEREVSGFHARVIQHECDHLDGMLYPMRMTDLSLLCFVDELRHGLPDLVQARRDTAGSIP